MPRTAALFALILFAAFGAVAPLSAQSAVIGGTVTRDSSGAALGEVEVSIASLGRLARTNYLGEFRIDRLPAGTYVLAFRRVGFLPRIDTITVKDGEAIDDEFSITAAPVELGAQHVTASGEKEALYLEEFNDRMKRGAGRFVTDSVLRREADGRSFKDFLKSKLPGMRLLRLADGSEALQSGRKGCSGPAFQCAGASGCTVSVYIDGVANYVSGVTQGPPTDFTQLKSEDFSAVEFYSSGATAPAKFNQTGSDCGVLLLWRRYRAP
jgi:hypothetical protein